MRHGTTWPPLLTPGKFAKLQSGGLDIGEEDFLIV